MRCSPRPVSSRGPGLCGAGAALPRVGDRAQHARAGAGRAGSAVAARYRRTPGRHAAACWSSAQTPRSRCLCCALPCPTGAEWRQRSPWRRGPIRDLRRARVAIRGRQAQRARAGSSDGRQLLRASPAISAAGISQRQPVPASGVTGALPITARLMSSRQQNRRVHAAAVDHARRYLPAGRLTAEVANEPPARALLDRTADAELLVLGTTRPTPQPGQPPQAGAGGAALPAARTLPRRGRLSR